MKSLVFVVLMLVSNLAFGFDHFAKFVGRYELASQPETNLPNCNWQNFKNLKQVEVKLTAGHYYQADLYSLLNNSSFHSYNNFIEYAYSDDEGLVNSAKISGDNTYAQYLHVDHTSATQTASSFRLTANGEYVNLLMTFDSQGYHCTYFVLLTKK